MEPEVVRQKLTELFGGQIRFNRDFEEYAGRLKESMQEDLLKWCSDCKNNLLLGSVPPKKEFKYLYVFFRKIGNNVRAALIKEQNSDFIELILSDHYAYDKKRQELGYKQSSYYGS